jgi:hypothetical protein
MIEPTTELEAVNEMLMSIGQAPVSTLAVSGIRDVNIAKARLESMARRVQSQGWNFNTDEDYDLNPDIDGVIAVPSGALKVDGQLATDDFTVRRHPTKGMAIYNKTERTFIFTAPIKVKVVWGFAFADLPETARCYIATAAGRRFQSKVIGSQILDRYEEEDEAKAWFNLQREERASRDTNLFRSNAAISGIMNRRY